MTDDDVRAIVLSLPDAVEGAHHGHPDFRIGTSIFGSLQPEKGLGALRLPQPLAESLPTRDPETYRIVSSKQEMWWVSIQLARASADDYRPLAEAAHGAMVAEKEAKKKNGC